MGGGKENKDWLSCCLLKAPRLPSLSAFMCSSIAPSLTPQPCLSLVRPASLSLPRVMPIGVTLGREISLESAPHRRVWAPQPVSSDSQGGCCRWLWLLRAAGRPGGAGAVAGTSGGGERSVLLRRGWRLQIRHSGTAAAGTLAWRFGWRRRLGAGGRGCCRPRRAGLAGLSCASFQGTAALSTRMLTTAWSRCVSLPQYHERRGGPPDPQSTRSAPPALRDHRSDR